MAARCDREQGPGPAARRPRPARRRPSVGGDVQHACEGYALDRGHLLPQLGRRGLSISAIAGVDLALWDLLGKSPGAPVWRLLGRRRAERIPAYASGGADEARIGEQLLGYVAQGGFRADKMRHRGVGQHTCPGRGGKRHLGIRHYARMSQRLMTIQGRPSVKVCCRILEPPHSVEPEHPGCTRSTTTPTVWFSASSLSIDILNTLLKCSTSHNGKARAAFAVIDVVKICSVPRKWRLGFGRYTTCTAYLPKLLW
jgi:mandelate racemase/muconate lactonizing enzyme-like protein